MTERVTLFLSWHARLRRGKMGTMRYVQSRTRLAVIPMLAMTVTACDKLPIGRTDSLRTVLGAQEQLGQQLQSQKDSLTRVVLDADAFLGQMDSAVRTVKGLPKSKRTESESPLADQVAARKEMMERVNALVVRAKATASQLAELQKKQSESQSQNSQLRQQLE